LQHCGDALQPHPGIHAGLGQGVHGAAAVPVVLHEDIVPDFDIAVAVLLGTAGGAAPDLGAVVVEDLGTGTTGAGVTHHPEVVGGVAGALVVADADQPCGGDTHLVVPDGVGLVVFGVDRHPELVGIQAQPVTGGEKLPGVEDGVPL